MAWREWAVFRLLALPVRGALFQVTIILLYIAGGAGVALYLGTVRNLALAWNHDANPYLAVTIAGTLTGFGLSYLPLLALGCCSKPECLDLLNARLMILSYSLVRWTLFFTLGSSEQLSLVTLAYCIDWCIPVFLLLGLVTYYLHTGWRNQVISD